MTEKLYYQDVYLREFSAKIRNIRGDGGKYQVLLDRTAFYPEGGGQGADQGFLEMPDGRQIPVTDVQEEQGEIWHMISKPLDAGTEITGRIDWDRRFDHMQQHSGEHIVSGMICRAFQCSNVGFHLGEDVVTIDFNARISMDEALKIEQQANAYLWEDHPAEILWPSRDQLKTMEYRSKKELEGDVRIVRFAGADCCACCGTHVSSSSQVGLVKFLSAKNFHEGTRLELLCGKRAMDFLAMNYRVNKAAAVLLSTSEENTADYVQKLLEENQQLKSLTASMEGRLFRTMAESLKGRQNALLIEEDLNGVQVRTLADLAADCCTGMAAVFGGRENHYNYAVIQRDGDIADFIRQMNQALNGRGGGRNGFAQGSVNASPEEIRAFFKETKE